MLVPMFIKLLVSGLGRILSEWFKLMMLYHDIYMYITSSQDVIS